MEVSSFLRNLPKSNGPLSNTHLSHEEQPLSYPTHSLQLCVWEKGLGFTLSVETHVDPIPPTINLVFLVLRPLSRASQKYGGEIIFATKTPLLSYTTTNQNHIYTTNVYPQAIPNK